MKGMWVRHSCGTCRGQTQHIILSELVGMSLGNALAINKCLI